MRSHGGDLREQVWQFAKLPRLPVCADSRQGDLMTPEEEYNQRYAVVQEARTWLGTPYHPAARLKGVGVDCAMLPIMVYVAVGILAPIGPFYYSPDWHMHKSIELYLQEVVKHSKLVEKPKMGDFVLYKWGRVFAH